MPEDAVTDRRTVIFDMDRTITRHGTFTPYIIFSARSRPWKLIWLPVVLFHMIRYKLGVISRKRLKEHMLSLFLAGLSRDEIRTVSEAFIERLFATGLKPGAVACITEHRNAGDRLVMATASMDFYAELIGRRLGFDSVVATGSCWDSDDRLLAEIDGENCYGLAKRDMILAVIPELAGDNGAGRKVMAYSDHISDLPMFQLADDVVAVDPSRRLKKEAESQGFRVLEWH